MGAFPTVDVVFCDHDSDSVFGGYDYLCVSKRRFIPHVKGGICNNVEIGGTCNVEYVATIVWMMWTTGQNCSSCYHGVL